MALGPPVDTSGRSTVLTIVNGVETQDFTDQQRRRSTSLVSNSRRYRPTHYTAIPRRVLPAVGFREVRALMHRLECSLTLHSRLPSTDGLPPVTTKRSTSVASHGGHSRTNSECGGSVANKPARNSVCAGRRRSSKLPSETNTDSCGQEGGGSREEGQVVGTKRRRSRPVTKRKTSKMDAQNTISEQRYVLAQNDPELRIVRR